MYTNARATEQIAILDSLDPVSQAAATVTTGWISAAGFHRFMAMINTGTLGASATVDAKIQQATDNSGTGVKDVTGKAITQIVKASGDNKQALINLRPEELDVNNGFAFFRLSITVGTAASLIAANVLGVVARNSPASTLNNTDVTQIVA